MILSDKADVRISIKGILTDMPDCYLVGEERGIPLGMQKAATLKPDVILIEQSSPLFDGVDFAARLEMNCIPSSVLLLCDDGATPRPVYSNNVLGYIRYGELNRVNLEKYFKGNKLSHVAPTAPLAAGGDFDIPALPFDRYCLFLFVWDDEGGDMRNTLQMFSEKTAGTRCVTGFKKNVLAIALNRMPGAAFDELIEELSALRKDAPGPLFVYRDLNGAIPLDKAMDFFCAKRNISCFFDDDNISVFTQGFHETEAVSDESLKEATERIRDALHDGDSLDLCLRIDAMFKNELPHNLDWPCYNRVMGELEYIYTCAERRYGAARSLPDFGIEADIGRTRDKVMRNFRGLMAETGRVNSPAVCEAIRYLRANFAENISLQEVSRHIRLSPSYLSRTFKKETGLNISDYITGIRLDRAKRMLAQMIKVKDVSKQVGFDDPKYFAKRFKKSEGCTPTEYAQKNLNGGAGHYL
jgi:AraC-like DNA-binding protein